MATKYGKLCAEYLTSMGYDEGAYDARHHRTSWTKSGKPPVVVFDGMAEHAFRMVKRDVDKIHGVKSISAVRKRNVAAIKGRQQSERERLAAEKARHEAELAEYERAVNERLGDVTTSEWNAICREIERREREIRDIDQLMRETPDSGHRGVEHAKHRA